MPRREVIEFRRQTLLPLDDVLGCLRDSIPKLTRSSLHSCLEQHGLAVSCRQTRLPENAEKASKQGSFTETAIGYVHIDLSELRLAEGKPRAASSARSPMPSTPC